MISSILIANRGEIAVRIIRTCRDMGIRSVAVYSEADRDALHVKMADDAVCIGPAATQQSYLNRDNLITAAVLKKCDAIHPGFGFLSENALFARETADAGIIFIGAKPQTIAKLGDKVAAKDIARAAGVPVIPGSDGAVETVEEGIRIAEKIGLPIIVKAAAGGGGRGMRIVRRHKDLADILKIAASEAESFFSDGTLYIEKYLESPRHVEVQIVADQKGDVVHLGERDCSVQRNHQKLLEESPSEAVNPELRETMGQDAVKLCRELEYSGAGTVEFLVAEGKHYFMEVNARIQVEHPVTEMITNCDIVRQQILAASGEPLDIRQDMLSLDGYALECRINALTPGKVSFFSPPLGPAVRMDTSLYSGGSVSPHYDSMIGKLIVRGKDREQGIARMVRALRELEIHGIRTNVDEQLRIITSREFISGEYGTDIYEKIVEKYAASGEA